MADTVPLGAGGRLLDTLDRTLRGVEFVTALFAGIVIFIVMWVGVAEIFLRKLFNSPLYGQLDVIEQTMSSYAILTLAYCWRAAGHIRVDLVIDWMRGRGRSIVELLTTLLALALVTALWPGILHYFQNAYEIGDSTINTQWPTWPSKFVPVIGFSILWVRLALEVFGWLRLIAHPDAVPIAVPEKHDALKEALEEAGEADVAAGHTGQPGRGH